MGRWVGSTALTLVDSISVCGRYGAAVLYWNTLLAFPFYTAVGKFAAAGALTIDSVTGMPILIMTLACRLVGVGVLVHSLRSICTLVLTHRPPPLPPNA